MQWLAQICVLIPRIECVTIELMQQENIKDKKDTEAIWRLCVCAQPPNAYALWRLR